MNGRVFQRRFFNFCLVLVYEQFNPHPSVYRRFVHTLSSTIYTHFIVQPVPFSVQRHFIWEREDRWESEIGKDEIMAYFKVQFQKTSGRNEENLGEGSCPPVREQNNVPCK